MNERKFGVKLWILTNEGDLGEPRGVPYRFPTVDSCLEYFTHTAITILCGDRASDAAYGLVKDDYLKEPFTSDREARLLVPQYQSIGLSVFPWGQGPALRAIEERIMASASLQLA